MYIDTSPPFYSQIFNFNLELISRYHQWAAIATQYVGKEFSNRNRYYTVSKNVDTYFEVLISNEKNFCIPRYTSLANTTPF